MKKESKEPMAAREKERQKESVGGSEQNKRRVEHNHEHNERAVDACLYTILGLSRLWRGVTSVARLE